MIQTKKDYMIVALSIQIFLCAQIFTLRIGHSKIINQIYIEHSLSGCFSVSTKRVFRSSISLIVFMST